MAKYNMDEPITLDHIGIERDFNDALKTLVPLIGKGQKGTVTIKVELARPEELDTVMTLTTTVGTSAPAPKKRKSLARLANDKVFVEPVPDPQNVLTLFKNEEVKEG